ncbi:Phage protein [Candidatus Paraburkholderia calva]|nr:Phage protein [Candidatus Paraburkholderia calva]
MRRQPNEASEYFYARRFGPGIDVGDPMRSNIRKLYTKIKTVDWLNALDAELVHEIGGPSSLALPPDWFIREPLRNGGLIIQAGAVPETGTADGPGKPILPQPSTCCSIRRCARSWRTHSTPCRTGRSTVALFLSTVVATEGWLRRFNVPENQINTWWVELHKTPKVTDERAVIGEFIQKLRGRMALPGRSA